MSRIMVVDDDAAIRRFVGALLEDEGHEVAMAAHGVEALDVMARSPDFDLIVLDMRMPVMDGAEFLERLATHETAPRVLVMTAARDPASLSPLVSAATSISKPFDLDTFLAVVGRMLAAAPVGGAEDRVRDA